MILQKISHTAIEGSEHYLKCLKLMKMDIDTSYVERLNLTIRDSLPMFRERGMNFGKKRGCIKGTGFIPSIV
jgi:hypothetical protein